MNELEPKKILIIDDDLFIAEIIQVSLEMSGKYTIKLCSSGKEAVEMITTFLPDIVIQDLFLEDMDGIDLLIKLKKDHNLEDIPFIVLTGSDESGIKRKALDAGAALFVQKPFVPQKLIEDINALLFR